MSEEEKDVNLSIGGHKVETKDFASGCQHCGQFGVEKDEGFGVDRCVKCGSLQQAK
jgi:hypothetical protein